MTDQPEHLDLRSQDIAEDKVRELLHLFPEVQTEGGKLDFDRLKLALGEAVDVGKERYGMNWPGKADCFRTIQMPSLGTLRPCPEESVNFDATENLVIEGDNLEVLKLLQKSYLGKVKMIYIDPPYNTGNDFIYPDNYAESLQTYLEYTGQVDAEGRKFSSNTEADGRFHSKWLNMMYPRLYLARNLLRDDGVLLVSIDDGEVRNLRAMCDELFGEENFICQFIWKSKSGGANDSRFVAVDHEYVVCYARNSDLLQVHKDRNAEVTTNYNLRDEGGEYALDRLDKQSIRYSPSLDFEITGPNEETYRLSHRDPQHPNATWRWGRRTVRERFAELVFKDGSVYTKNYKKDGATPRSLLVDERFGRTRTGKTSLEDVLPGAGFDNPKPAKLVSYFAAILANGADDIVLDFFAGSGTTAHAVLDLNRQDDGSRKFILVQLPEPTEREDYPTIAEIAEERVRRVIRKLNDADASKLDLNEGKKQDRGFRVFKLAESNFKPWNADVAHDPVALESQLELHVDHIRAGRTSEDLLFEILLKSGFELGTAVETLDLAGTPVYSVAGGALLVCLARELTLDLIRAIGQKKPERVVCLDEGFAGNDQLKANAVQIFKTEGVTSFRTA